MTALRPLFPVRISPEILSLTEIGVRTKMSEDNSVELILSILTSIIGGAASVFLVKKMVDALDTNKKVRTMLPSHCLGSGCCERVVWRMAEEV